MKTKKHKLFFYYVPTDHCGNINEIVHDKNNQLIMYNQTLTINDW